MIRNLITSPKVVGGKIICPFCGRGVFFKGIGRDMEGATGENEELMYGCLSLNSRHDSTILRRIISVAESNLGKVPSKNKYSCKTPKQKKKLVDLIELGVSLKEIVQQTGISYNWVRESRWRYAERLVAIIMFKK